MTEEKRVPAIRFKGFDEVWEEYSLGEITQRITRKNSNLETTLPLTISAADGIIDQISYFNNRVASKDLSNYYLIKRGEFAYNKSTSQDSLYGAVKRLDDYDKGALSTLYIAFSLSNDIDSDCFLSYYESNNWHNEIRIRAAEGARNHGLLNILTEKFFGTKLALPSESNEQMKIGILFKKLNQLISVENKRYKSLQHLKETMLEKMFPKDGADVPEIRFKGFSGAWRKYKLNEIFDVNSGKDYANIEPGNIPVYGTGGYMLSVNDKLSDSNAIGIGRKGTIDKPQLLMAPFWTVDTLFYMVPKSTDNLYYLYALSQTIKWKHYNEATGVPSLSKNNIENISIYNAPEDEQNVIANYFQLLDKCIKQCVDKIASLTKIKKALLEKMFV